MKRAFRTKYKIYDSILSFSVVCQPLQKHRSLTAFHARGNTFKAPPLPACHDACHGHILCPCEHCYLSISVPNQYFLKNL